MTPAMLSGDFSVIASTQCQTRQITLAAPFVNNVIPKSLMDPIAMKIAKLLPTNGQLNACGLVNYATGGNQQQYQIPVKVDYALNAKHSMFARYMLSNNYTPLFYDPSNPLFTGSTTGQTNTHPVHGARRHLDRQLHACQQHSHRDESRHQPAVHSGVQDSCRLRNSHLRVHPRADEPERHQRRHARRRGQQPWVLQHPGLTPAPRI